MHLQANLSEVTGLNIKHRPIEPKDIHIKNDTNKRVQNYAEGGGKPSAEALDSINETQKEKQHSKNKNSQKHINFAEEGRVDNRKPVAKKKSVLEGLIEDTDPRVQGSNYINSQGLDYEGTRGSDRIEDRITREKEITQGGFIRKEIAGAKCLINIAAEEGGKAYAKILPRTLPEIKKDIYKKSIHYIEIV